MDNIVTNIYAMFNCDRLRIVKALGNFQISDIKNKNSVHSAWGPFLVQKTKRFTKLQGVPLKNIRFIFSSFLTQMLTNFNNSFNAAFSDELQKKLE